MRERVSGGVRGAQVSSQAGQQEALSESVRQKTALLVSVVDLAAVVEQFP